MTIMSRIMIFLLILWPAAATALTMEQVVARGLEHHPRISQFRHLQTSRAAALNAARAVYLPSVDLAYIDLVHSEENYYTTGRQLSVFYVEASLNLFNGFSDQADILKARSLERASVEKKKSVKADIILSIKEAFIGVLTARSFMETAGESVRLLERQQRDAALHLDQGLIAKNDLLRVEVDLATARQELLQSQGNYDIAVKSLENTIGLPLENGEIVEDPSGVPGTGTLDFEGMKKQMLAARSELAYLAQIRDAYENEQKAIAGGYLPAVDLVVGHERYGDTPVPWGRDNTYDHDSTAQIRISWNLFDGRSRHHRIQENRAAILSVDAQIKETAQALELQLSSALTAYRTAKGKLETAVTAVTQAEENYRVTDNRLRQRQATIVDILDARFYLTRARNQKISAFYDLHKSAASIDRVLER